MCAPAMLIIDNNKSIIITCHIKIITYRKGRVVLFDSLADWNKKLLTKATVYIQEHAK